MAKSGRTYLGTLPLENGVVQVKFNFLKDTADLGDLTMKEPFFSEANGCDRVAKVFRVETSRRRCLICEQLFSQEGARDHAQVACHPVPAKLVSGNSSAEADL